VARELGEILGIEPLNEADERRLPSLTRSVGQPILDCSREIFGLGEGSAIREGTTAPRTGEPTRSASRFITVCTVV
jgi:hypothetical protein